MSTTIRIIHYCRRTKRTRGFWSRKHKSHIVFSTRALTASIVESIATILFMMLFISGDAGIGGLPRSESEIFGCDAYLTIARYCPARLSKLIEVLAATSTIECASLSTSPRPPLLYCPHSILRPPRLCCSRSHRPPLPFLILSSGPEVPTEPRLHY